MNPILSAPEDLMDRACAQAGLTDFGDYPFREGLNVLIDTVRKEARLNAGGIAAFEDNVVTKLVNRLRMIADLKAHPEIMAEQITRPIIIIGLARSGTTKLQRLLSVAPGVQRLDLWRLLNPAPFPDARPGVLDPRITYARQIAEFIATHYPEQHAAHQFLPEEAEEELWMMEMTWESVLSWFRYRVPSFLSWIQGRDQTAQYKFLKLQLQYLQWQDGGGRNRPWIMKCPHHLAYLDLLFETFPDALVVHCHRSPTENIASVSSATLFSYRTSSDEVDPIEHGHAQLEYWNWHISEYLRQRTPRREKQIVDVWYSDVVNDSGRVVREIYDRAGMKLTPEALQAFEKWEAEHAQHLHGKHSYSLEEFGLSAALVDSVFAAYNKRFSRESVK